MLFNMDNPHSVRSQYLMLGNIVNRSQPQTSRRFFLDILAINQVVVFK